MTILGIETSCDETAAAIIHAENNHVTLQANAIASSLTLHSQTGGIIPEQAAREQLKYILPVINEALKQANTSLDAIDAFAITYGPGLIGSLLVGVETIKTLSYVLDKPLIPVNHMIGHIYANWIDKKTPIEFPAIALVVSGGHTDLLLMKNHKEHTLLGGTRDDAAGECFDKCARLLGYAYPGGPHISKLAQLGDAKAIPLPRPMLGSNDYAFSFSGLKTAFLNATKTHFPLLRTTLAHTSGGWDQILLNEKTTHKEKQYIYNLCASLQQSIVDVLLKKTLKAALQHNAKSILLSGGVAANTVLRSAFTKQAEKHDITLSIPEKHLCTDNAAMIASAAYYRYTPQKWDTITADPELYF